MHLNKIIVLAVLLASVNLFSRDCSRHPIYCQIIRNRPDIDKDYAFELSNIIFKHTRARGVDSRLFTAILMQESRYVLGAKNCRTGILVFTEEEKNNRLSKCLSFTLGCFCLYDDGEPKKCLNCKVLVKEPIKQCRKYVGQYQPVRTCYDFGISQIFHVTARSFGFDIEKLTNDLDYSVEAGVIVLADFKRMYSSREPNDWWTRYNSPTRHHRQVYRELVERWK